MQVESRSNIMRSARVGLLATLVFLSEWALGLGLGKIDVQSALSQPLRAEIELVNVENWAASDLKVALASAEDFERLGVQMAPGLFDLEFEAIDARTGARIRVQSESAVLEPFLHFVLVLDWPGGRLLKEYTVLLDLPGMTEVVPPLSSVQESPGERQPARRPASSGLRAEVGQLTTIGDTLWDIALATRPDRSISIPQMMLAIQEENPEAFIDGNINRLKAGYRLQIPDFSSVVRLEAGAAEAAVEAQNKALSGSEAQKKTSSSPEPSLDETSDSITEAIEPISSMLEEVSGAELRLVAEDEIQESQVPSSEVAELTESLSQAQAALAASESSQQALSDRLAALETNVGSLTSMIEIKDRELADLEQELKTLRDQEAVSGAAWANPLVLGLLGVVVLLVVLLLVLSNRLRQQARWMQESAANVGPRSSMLEPAVPAAVESARSSSASEAPEAEKQTSTENTTSADEQTPVADEQTPVVDEKRPGAENVAIASGAESVDPEEVEVPASALDISVDLSEIDLDLESSEALEDLDLGDSLDLDDIDSEGIDSEGIDLEDEAMSHPLDLARAYIEMGDSASAKTQLAKVIATGSPEEVRDAEQLLEQLPH